MFFFSLIGAHVKIINMHLLHGPKVVIGYSFTKREKKHLEHLQMEGQVCECEHQLSYHLLKRQPGKCESKLCY